MAGLFCFNCGGPLRYDERSRRARCPVCAPGAGGTLTATKSPASRSSRSTRKPATASHPRHQSTPRLPGIKVRSLKGTAPKSPSPKKALRPAPKRFKLTPLEPNEHEIQRQIIRALRAQDWIVVRFNSGAVKVEDRFIRFYMLYMDEFSDKATSSGLPDLMAFRGWQRDVERDDEEDEAAANEPIATCETVMLEVKKPGGKTRESQQAFIDFAARHGIKVHVCDSWQAALELVQGLPTNCRPLTRRPL